MSAINEWFGYYNALFTYIRDTYGAEELEEYFSHLAREAYSDVTPAYRDGGLEAIADRYLRNFKKDGDEFSAGAEIREDVLTMAIRCPAYTHGVEVKHPARRVGDFFCQCCQRLNRKILSEAGYELSVERGEGCYCEWNIKKQDG